MPDLFAVFDSLRDYFFRYYDTPFALPGMKRCSGSDGTFSTGRRGPGVSRGSR